MLPEIRELIETRDGTTLSEVLDMWQPADIAELFEDLSDDDERAAFQLLHGPQRTLIFKPSRFTEICEFLIIIITDMRQRPIY